ncbi:MAG: hypothetical protein KC448_05880 [Yoonia sp.]|nr:hypothetical protein [Yoonia sp.]
MKYAFIVMVWAGVASADAPVIETATFAGGRFDVTLSHPDTGWDHYADGWRVEDASGAVIGVRVLGHPHVNEQPFTRSLNIDGPLPAVVYIRSRCIVDGWSDATFELATQ